MPAAVYPRDCTPAVDRVLAKIKVHPLGCWEFTGGLTDGYGRVNALVGGRRRPVTAHRITYEDAVGPIPDGWHVDHLCFNPRCVNPAHLEAVPPDENTRRMWRAGRGNTGAANRAKTHCIHGHPFDEANTRVTPQGHRSCRTCARIRVRAAYRRAHTSCS